MLVQKSSSFFFGTDELKLKKLNESLLKKAREMLYQAAVDGYISGMSWHIVSYDIERAYLEQNAQLSAEIKQELKQKRLISYAVLQHPFESHFGNFDLRPHDIEFEDESSENNSIIEKIRDAINQYDLDRSNKGLSTLFLEAYPKEWDELENCD